MTLHGNAGAGCSAGSFQTLRSSAGRQRRRVRCSPSRRTARGVRQRTSCHAFRWRWQRGLFGGDVYAWDVGCGFTCAFRTGWTGEHRTVEDGAGTLAHSATGVALCYNEPDAGAEQWLAKRAVVSSSLTQLPSRSSAAALDGPWFRPRDYERSQPRPMGPAIRSSGQRVILHVGSAVLRIRCRCTVLRQRSSSAVHPDTEWAWLLASRR